MRIAVVIIGRIPDHLQLAQFAGSQQKITGPGGSWTVGEDQLTGPDGTKLARVAGHIAYWFAWGTFFPDAEIW